MRKIVLLLASLVLAVLLASALAFVAPLKQAKADSPTDHGRIVFIGPGTAGIGAYANPNDIYTMKPDGTDIRRVTDYDNMGESEESSPMISPDGRKIVFFHYDPTNVPFRGGGITAITTDDSRRTSVSTNSSRARTPVWSPDGTKVAVVDDAVFENYPYDMEYEADIFVTDFSESDGRWRPPVNVTNTPFEDEANPDWSPDGKKIAFDCSNCAGSNGSKDIYAINVDGSGLTQLTDTAGVNEEGARWSPDDSKIAYTRSEYVSGTLKHDVYVMNADGSSQRPLVADPDGSENNPSWSPNGTRLLFSGYGGPYGNSGMFKMDADGTNVTRITNEQNIWASEGRWGPSPGDIIPPQLNLPADITANATSASGAQVNFTATATDDTDGSVSVDCSPASGNTFAVGTTPVSCSATDAAGNKATGTFKVNVIYDFRGFFSPVNNLPTLNVVRGGGAVPVKFGLSGDQGLDVFAEGYPKSQQINCESTAQVDNIEQTATAGESSLSYDATTDQYTYVWKTNKAWAGTCRQFTMKLDDGTTHSANFKFRS